MADIKVSALAAITDYNAADIVMLGRSGLSKRMVMSDLRAATNPDGTWVVVTKSADESRNTTTTLAIDTHLKATLVSGGLYEFEAFIGYISPVGGTTPDIKISFGEDGIARGSITSIGFSSADAAQTTSGLASNVASSNFGTAATLRAIRVFGATLSNGGAFGLYWSQVTSGGNDVTVKAGSIFRYRRFV